MIATEEEFYAWLDTCPTEWVDKDYQPEGWVRITFYYNEEKEEVSDA
jgi:hypothetical protein